MQLIFIVWRVEGYLKKLKLKHRPLALTSYLICFFKKQQENAMHWNNHDDMLQPSFSLKILIFSEAYI